MAEEKNIKVETPIPPQRQDPRVEPDREEGIHQKPDPEKKENDKENNS